jgi:uncharacterized caspase-like protein
MRIARFAAIIACSVLAILLCFGPATADKRVALVIGNGAYKSVGKLTNPTNDAKAIAGMLQYAGFDVVELHENLGIREMRQAINDFADSARDADTAVVYYSGHGIEVNGINYLIPVDAVLGRDTDVPYEAFSLDNLVQVLEPARRLRLVMLDACRDNPFVRSMKRTAGTRAIGRGLAAVEPTSVNTLIGFAAKAGSTASDGDGANSPYATAVLKHVATPGLDLRIAFGRVRDEVLTSTKNKQEPFVYGSLGGTNVSIVDAPASAGADTAPPPQAPVQTIDRATQAWAATKDTTSIAILEDFIRQFGNTPYGSMARARLEELKGKNVAAAGPPAAQPNVSSAAPGPANDAAERAWAATQNTTNIAVLESFMARFPGTFYADLARARIEELKKGQVAVAVPPTSPKVPEKGTSDSRSIQQGQRDPKGCGGIAGTWTWNNNREVTIKLNGSIQASDGAIGGNWKCEEGVYVIVWNHGFTDLLKLSSDGKRLSGSNNVGFAISATRRASASATREAPGPQQTESQQQNQNTGGIGGLINGVLKGAGDLVGGVLGGNNQQPQDVKP